MDLARLQDMDVVVYNGATSPNIATVPQWGELGFVLYPKPSPIVEMELAVPSEWMLVDLLTTSAN
jgi:hypothetical protein